MHDTRTIWIDLDNTPHVPFFKPVMAELEKRGFALRVTARNAYQVCELADRMGIRYRQIGRHYGKNRVLKFLGTLWRGVQLLPVIRAERPCLALAHGSRSQTLAARLSRVPSVTITDYEHASHLRLFSPDWLIVPEVIACNAFEVPPRRVLTYPGIKEDVYAPSFVPDSSIRQQLGLSGDTLCVAFRPPATEAHYHNPESERLADAAVNFLLRDPRTRIVVLPRNARQKDELMRRWSREIASGRVVLPPHVVDGLNLLWHSDIVVSGGGTMNREAAALGVPVYSIFRGKIGAVDQFLAKEGRLVMLESVADVETKLRLERRQNAGPHQRGDSAALRCVVDHIVAIIAQQGR